VLVQYDRLASRWVISKIGNPFPDQEGYLQCVAVSTTEDPTGQFYRYSFGAAFFNDYPKLGVWPDGYYFTFNSVDNLGQLMGGTVCAYDRESMLAGAAPRPAQCRNTWPVPGL